MTCMMNGGVETEMQRELQCKFPGVILHSERMQALDLAINGPESDSFPGSENVPAHQGEVRTVLHTSAHNGCTSSISYHPSQETGTS